MACFPVSGFPDRDIGRQKRQQDALVRHLVDASRANDAVLICGHAGGVHNTAIGRTAHHAAQALALFFGQLAMKDLAGRLEDGGSRLRTRDLGAGATAASSRRAAGGGRGGGGDTNPIGLSVRANTLAVFSRGANALAGLLDLAAELGAFVVCQLDGTDAMVANGRRPARSMVARRRSLSASAHKQRGGQAGANSHNCEEVS